MIMGVGCTKCTVNKLEDDSFYISTFKSPFSACVYICLFVFQVIQWSKSTISPQPITKQHRVEQLSTVDRHITIPTQKYKIVSCN